MGVDCYLECGGCVGDDSVHAQRREFGDLLTTCRVNAFAFERSVRSS